MALKKAKKKGKPRDKWLERKDHKDRKAAGPPNPFLTYGEEVAKRSRYQRDAVTEAWIEVLRDVDEKQEVKPLADMLRSKYPLSRSARDFLANLIERYKLTRKRGTQPQPAYTESRAERVKFEAAADVRRLVENKKGMEVADALAIVSEQEGIPLRVLANYYKNKGVR